MTETDFYGAMVDDEPLSISVSQMLSGLTDMALMLTGYHVAAGHVACDECGIIVDLYKLSMLELVNDVFEHHDVFHGGK